ncbi:hypothetical protein LshimejAT787_0404030 [Lyophyllum shimeji]|uniref:Uncharacterized protein n=1 Tax=Lyophyllum shimeji TaxID=47721 RepID=A0A9P3PL81_LYOSH|nr:hypothetical protein LshimejAT787_0404030 [Lyophyllum shimeji]
MLTTAHTRITPLNTSSTGDLITSLKATSLSLGDIFEKLQSQTTEVATLGQTGIAPEIKRLHRQLKEQDELHREGIAEIHLILKDCLETQLFEHLKQQAQREIEAEIDGLVREQVAECLKTIIPQDLQDEVAAQKSELEELRIQLHNSESRRANASLRANQPNEILHVIYMSNGEVSKHYPKSLQDLFDLDSETSKALMVDYELPDISEAGDRNLNRFIQFCGVSYQMVRTGPNTRRVGLEH